MSSNTLLSHTKYRVSATVTDGGVHYSSKLVLSWRSLLTLSVLSKSHCADMHAHRATSMAADPLPSMDKKSHLNSSHSATVSLMELKKNTSDGPHGEQAKGWWGWGLGGSGHLGTTPPVGGQ